MERRFPSGALPPGNAGGPPGHCLECMTALGLAARTDMPEPLVRSLARAAEEAGHRSLWSSASPPPRRRCGAWSSRWVDAWRASERPSTYP
jgi:hypothetical protein